VRSRGGCVRRVPGEGKTFVGIENVARFPGDWYAEKKKWNLLMGKPSPHRKSHCKGKLQKG